MSNNNQKTRWTDEEVDWLKMNYSGLPTRAIHERYMPQRTINAIDIKAKRMGIRKSYTSLDSPSPFFRELRVEKPESVERLFEALKKFQKASTDLSTRMEMVEVSLDTCDPIILAFLADAHIGSLYTDYEVLDERVRLLENTDRAYVVSCGDTVDNYLPAGKHSTGMFGTLLPPAIQKSIAEMIFIRLKGKWLGAVQGCHDEWSHDLDDFDWTRFLAEKIECPNLGFGGFIDLTVGNVTYRIALRHRYRYNSSFNLTHTVKRMREQFGDFDVGCVAHHHQADIEHLAMADKDRVFIRPGSFKKADRYARSIGYRDTGHQVPCIVLDPTIRKIVPFMNLGDAVRFLRTYE